MKRKTKKIDSRKSAIVWFGFLGTLATLTYFGIYFVSIWLSDPKLIFVLQGQPQDGHYIFPRKQGSFVFVISTKQGRSVDLTRINVLFNPSTGLKISPLDDEDPFKLEFSEDREQPYKLVSHDFIELKQGNNKAFGFNYTITDTTEDLSLVFQATGSISSYDWSFPWNLFTAQPKVCSQRFNLRYFDTSSLPKDKQLDSRSIAIPPRESLTPLGSLPKYMGPLWLRSSKDSVQYSIHSIER